MSWYPGVDEDRAEQLRDARDEAAELEADDRKCADEGDRAAHWA